MSKIRYLILVASFFLAFHLEAFDKVVIWGHKLHSHTHSYIHDGFYKAFRHLGYETYWFDEADDVRNFDFSGSLFITEGQVDRNIPIRDDCFYMLHNCNKEKYLRLKSSQWFVFQVYTDDVLSNPNVVKVEPFIYYDILGKCLFMPWATDLLPHEIDEIKRNFSNSSVHNCVYWIGTIGTGTFGNIGEMQPFIEACRENNIAFCAKTHVDSQGAIDLIRKSYLAPTIVGKWQKEKGYIPCRIFKNISYGKMGLTNSLRVWELFEGNIVYNPDTYQLFYDAQEAMEIFSEDDRIRLMDFVKEKHTYLNRIATLLDFLHLVEEAFTPSASSHFR